MNHNCNDDKYNKLIKKNKHIFEKMHNKKSISIMNFDYSNNLIIVPVSINICLTKDKYKIDFIKYAKYIIKTLNDGFSGNINSKYQNEYYNKEYFKKQLQDKYNKVASKYAEVIHNYINKKTDTKIRFYLETIEYYNMNFEVKFEDNNTEKLVNYFNKCGFKIREENKLNLNINIVKFTCSTLGVSIFPWMKYLSKIPNLMMVFLDYTTIHPDLSKNNFNECRTLIHEVGHIFGLKHTFYNNQESKDVYKILLGKIIYEREFINDINNTNYTNINNDIKSKFKIDKDDIKIILNKINEKKPKHQLYNDIPYQKNPTIENPIETNNYQIINNEVCNFCCFMDYSPDVVLTHFTESQKRIMYYFIIIFKSYLISNSKKIESKYFNNNIIKLNINEKLKINIENNSININTHDEYKEYFIQYDDLYSYKFVSNNENKKIENISKILSNIINNIN